jgi:hypothetical protein
MFPAFELACKKFFGLPVSANITYVDPYWNVSVGEIYKALWKAFGENWKKYLPDLYTDGKDFLTRAQEISSQVSHTEKSDKTHHISVTKINQPSMGITGQMHHGKSTIAEYLCKEKQYVEYSFAGPLKEGIKILFGFSDDQVYGAAKDLIDDRWKISPRVVLQRIGTELFRNDLKVYLPQVRLQYSLWIENFFRWKKNHPDVSVVVSDCRFPDEATALKSLEIPVYRVIRPSLTIQNNNQCKHSSEALQNEIIVDDTLLNDSTVSVLYKKVDDLLTKIITKSKDPTSSPRMVVKDPTSSPRMVVKDPTSSPRMVVKH